MKYLSPLDPHVHLRGLEYQEPFLDMALEDAEAVGLCALLEQPNPVPQLTSLVEIINRNRSFYEHKTGKYSKNVFPRLHGCHAGMTNDPLQVRDMIRAVMDGKTELNSIKTFYTHSTGNMGILDPEKQKFIWNSMGEMGFRGVHIGHFEDEKMYVNEFSPTIGQEQPIMHSRYQTPEAELGQVMAQIRNAIDAKFQGTFYIAHVSNPDTVEFVKLARKVVNFPIILEVTFHHMFLNEDDYAIHGHGVKMNPPLRSKILQERLLGHVLNGKCDIIGTDHAPHPKQRKEGPKPASGIPAIPFWPRGIQLLRELGIGEERLRSLTFEKANEVFELGLTPTMVDIEYQPKLWDKYFSNPFSRIH